MSHDPIEPVTPKKRVADRFPYGTPSSIAAKCRRRSTTREQTRRLRQMECGVLKPTEASNAE